MAKDFFKSSWVLFWDSGQIYDFGILVINRPNFSQITNCPFTSKTLTIPLKIFFKPNC